MPTMRASFVLQDSLAYQVYQVRRVSLDQPDLKEHVAMWAWRDLPVRQVVMVNPVDQVK